MSTATSTSFDIGDQPTLVFTFTNEAGDRTFQVVTADGLASNELMITVQ